MKINLTFSGDENILFMWPVVHCIMYLVPKNMWKLCCGWPWLHDKWIFLFIHISQHLDPFSKLFFMYWNRKCKPLQAADQRVLPNCSACWESVFKLVISKTPAPRLGSDLWNKIKLSKSYTRQNSFGLGFGRRDTFSFFIFCFNNPFW